MFLKKFEPSICVVGLGYVGLPLAYEFARNNAKVSGFDIDQEKIDKLKKNIDPSNEVSSDKLSKVNIEYSTNPKIISNSNFIIVAVPTPVNKNHEPELNILKKASKMVGQNLSKGSIVVFESTVYPGVTEDICLPILEENSSLKCGTGFYIGYSPERVNPGDKDHTINKIIKIVSGMNSEILDIIAKVYNIPCKAGVYKAQTIKVAESAKVIENIQRDINIALANELSIIFNKLDINTKDVIEAAGTKWNFQKYYPGLVGGHCIGVDPYYLLYRARQLGYESSFIVAGREINNYMTEHVTSELIKQMIKSDIKIKNSKVLIMGLSFKENVNDIRNSKAKEIIDNLKNYEINVKGYDPLVEKSIVLDNFGVENIDFNKNNNFDAIIVFSPHKEFKSTTLKQLKKRCSKNVVLFDIKGFYNKNDAEKEGFDYITL